MEEFYKNLKEKSEWKTSRNACNENFSKNTDEFGSTHQIH